MLEGTEWGEHVFFITFIMLDILRGADSFYAWSNLQESQVNSLITIAVLEITLRLEVS